MNPAAVPSAVEDVQGDGRWLSQHERFLADSKEKEPEILFIGDSLIANLCQSEIWSQMFEPLHCLNFGIGGDQTQHVLWRIRAGELDCMEPKVIVLLVGTNNHDHNADEVAGGIIEIVQMISDKQPQAQILVMAIPPRGEKPNKLREKIDQINNTVSQQLVDIPNTLFISYESSVFINATDQTISHHDMHDYLHLTKRGYQKLCEPILDEVQNVLQTFVKVQNTSAETASMSGDLSGDDP